MVGWIDTPTLELYIAIIYRSTSLCCFFNRNFAGLNRQVIAIGIEVAF